MPNRKTLSAACAAALVALPATVEPEPASARAGAWPLRINSSGERVRSLQVDLSRLGFRTAADGAFGPRTRRSVRAYERSRHITVDGRVSRPQARGIATRAGRGRSVPPAETDKTRAVIGPDGRTALAPASAPQPVKDAIAAANRITDKPYRYGGGHGRFEDTGYDCSGSVSYVLHGAGRLRRPRASSGFESYGRSGRGEWITVYANSGHAYAVIAGLRFDTSGPGQSGPRWRSRRRSPRSYTIRHPRGL